MVSLIAYVAALAATSQASFGLGVHNVSSFTPNVVNEKWKLQVWFPLALAPEGKAETLRVMVFVAGFQQPTSQYEELLNAVSSHGIIIIGLGWKLSLSLNYTALAEEVGGVLSFVVDGALASELSSQAQPALGMPNVSAIVLGAHSIGSHVLRATHLASHVAS